jgi:hypothetical protein
MPFTQLFTMFLIPVRDKDMFGPPSIIPTSGIKTTWHNDVYSWDNRARRKRFPNLIVNQIELYFKQWHQAIHFEILRIELNCHCFQRWRHSIDKSRIDTSNLDLLDIVRECGCVRVWIRCSKSTAIV